MPKRIIIGLITLYNGKRIYANGNIQKYVVGLIDSAIFLNITHTMNLVDWTRYLEKIIPKKKYKYNHGRCCVSYIIYIDISIYRNIEGGGA